ncbi:MAG: SDR family NAD(P)-dependent oxidoreductase [Hyphomicrobiales bacterium]|nr:SDR family NAD(P)-dependent oxidoreductase [Hyphomicrobiales bacterium]
MRFTGKTAAITGAAGNLGRAVAAAFAADGAKCLLIDHTVEVLNMAYPDAPAETKIAVDLTDRAAVVEALGGTGADILCAIAGGFHMGEPVHETPEDKWDLMQDLNVTTLVNSVHAVVPGMIARGSGKIVTIGANAATKGVPAMGAYCATKGAVLRLTEAMSGELRDRGINVNCVMPSIIDTPANRAAMPGADPAKWVPPADLAAVITFLASDAAKSVHGALVPVVGLS